MMPYTSCIRWKTSLYSCGSMNVKKAKKKKKVYYYVNSFNFIVSSQPRILRTTL